MGSLYSQQKAERKKRRKRDEETSVELAAGPHHAPHPSPPDPTRLGVGHRGKEQHSHPNRKQALGQHVQRVGPEPERVK